jgi:hypothetical protein
MNIFFDNSSLEDGLQFDETFMRGLARSLVAVPFVTADALARMCKRGSETRIDHVLLEWWLALILAKAERTTLRYILPIFCGEVGGQGSACSLQEIQPLFHVLIPTRPQITVSPAGCPVVGNLFTAFDFGQLPNVVNGPTYDRLCAFLRKDMKRDDLVPPAMSVRDVVEDIKKFNTSGTLCWALDQETTAGSTAVQDGLRDFGATQRVFAHCAKPVVAKVEAAVAMMPARMSSTSGDLAEWLASQDLLDFARPLKTLGARVLKDLAFGVREGDITVESLIEAGAGSRLQARRLIREATALLNSS